MLQSGVSRCRAAATSIVSAPSLRPQRGSHIRRRPYAARSPRCCRSCRFQSSTTKNQSNKNNNPASAKNTNTPTESTESITFEDIRSLQQDIKSLQTLLQQSRAQQNETLESLTRTLTARTSQIEVRLDEINDHVRKIGALEKVVATASDLLHLNPAIRSVVDNLETIVQRSRPYVQNYKYVLLAVGVSVTILWKYRSNLVYERTSEEVADLARLTLEQESLRLSIQETLQTVANSPATLTTLNDLVQTLIAHERTQQHLVHLLVFAVNTPEVQTAVLDLLQVVFEDPKLQELTGAFLLKGLDMESVKAMLDAQTAELVRNTVSDDSVQQATAVGLQRSLWYSITPSFLWRFIEPHKNEKDKGDENESNSHDNSDPALPKNGTKGRDNESVSTTANAQEEGTEHLPSQ